MKISVEPRADLFPFVYPVLTDEFSQIVVFLFGPGCLFAIPWLWNGHPSVVNESTWHHVDVIFEKCNFLCVIHFVVYNSTIHFIVDFGGDGVTFLIRVNLC